MPVGNVPASAVAAAAAGTVLIWSGVKGASVSTALRDVISGKAPAAAEVSPLTAGTAAGGGGPIPAGTPGTISYTAAETYWILAGGPSSVAPTMAAIATAESGRRPGAVQQGQPYQTTGWGLWQITPGNSEPGIGTDKALLNPLTNARAAVAKYRSEGLGAWTTYTSGAYLAYMGGA